MIDRLGGHEASVELIGLLRILLQDPRSPLERCTAQIMETVAKASSNAVHSILSSVHNVSDQVLDEASYPMTNSITAAVLLSLVLIAVTSLLIWRSRFSQKDLENSVPGSISRLPFIGDGGRYLNAYYHQKTREWHDQQERKYGAVHKARIMGRTFVFLDAKDGNKFVLNNSSDDKNLKGFWPPSLIDLLGPHSSVAKTGDRYVAHRNHLLRTFMGVDVIHKYIGLMDRKAREHVQRDWVSQDGCVVKAYPLLEAFTFDVVASLCMGLNNPAELNKMRHDFAVFSRGMFMARIRLPGFGFYQSLKAGERIHAQLRPHIAQRRVDLKEGRATPDQDFLSILLSQPDVDGHVFTEDEMLQRMVQTFWGGYDTSGSTLSSVLRYVAQHPKVYEELIKEHARIAARKAEGELLTTEDVRNMKYSWRVVNESMRLTPGVQCIWREANKDFKYKDYTIHKGDTLVLSAANSYWREEFYKDWEKFDPSRFEKGTNGGAPPFSFFPFGGGHRLCPGKEFAKLNMMSFLYHFLRYIKWDLVIPDEKTVYSFFPFPAQDLPLKIAKVKAF